MKYNSISLSLAVCVRRKQLTYTEGNYEQE